MTRQLFRLLTLFGLAVLIGSAWADGHPDGPDRGLPMDSQVYYRQASQETAEYLQRSLGPRSGFAHSHTTHEGVETSEGQAEQAVALMTAQEIKQLGDEEIIGFHRNLPPFRAKRMGFPLLIERRSLLPPQLSVLP